MNKKYLKSKNKAVKVKLPLTGDKWQFPYKKSPEKRVGIMHKNKSTNNDYIQGIVCDVKNCVYHEPDRKCYAKQIEVGPNFAVSSADTICATFKSK